MKHTKQRKKKTLTELESELFLKEYLQRRFIKSIMLTNNLLGLIKNVVN